MVRRIAIMFLLLLPLGMSLDIGPRPASGQTGSFRPLSPFYVLVGETVYYLDVGNPPFGWHQIVDLPPVPASSLVTLEAGLAITQSGEGWIHVASGWQSVGVVPGLVAVHSATWGALKAKYR